MVDNRSALMEEIDRVAEEAVGRSAPPSRVRRGDVLADVAQAVATLTAPKVSTTSLLTLSCVAFDASE